MKIRLVLLTTAAMMITLFLSSCRKEDPVTPDERFNERSSGTLLLDVVKAIVVQNMTGPVIIEGNIKTTEIGWYMDKWVIAGSQAEADQFLSQLVVQLTIVGDTAYITLPAPAGALRNSALLSLTLPNSIPCILRTVRGTSEISYLHSSFIGESVAGVTITGQRGNCELINGVGDVAVQIFMPDGGKCNVHLASGNITLSIPLTTSAEVSAQAAKGSISHSSLSFWDTLRTSDAYYGTLGSGSGKIQLSTGSGNITIRGF